MDAIGELVSDAIDWLDDHPDDEEEAYILQRSQLKAAANPLLGIKATGAPQGAEAGDGKPRGTGESKEQQDGESKSGGQEAAWRLGPNGCIVEAVD